MALWNEPNSLLRRERNRRYRQSHGGGTRQMRPFVGVDGEGGGTDDIGRQHFLLLRAGGLELFNNNEPLRTARCLDFLLSIDPKPIYVGFFFTYDATQILRDLPPERLKRLFDEQDNGPGQSRYTFWGDYAIEFRPRQYFRVARTTGVDRMHILPGSARTINEVGGFFQKSFVEALKDWQVGDAATVATIAENKERRSEFTTMTHRERGYCAAECRLLAELMTEFRSMCATAGIVPRSWRGAGWIAARLHELNGTPKQRNRTQRPPTLDMAAMDAYYGGRFEITTIGRIPGPVYEYDINSAYPAAMLQLPCPIHTQWHKFKGEPDPSWQLYLARLGFDHISSLPLCGLPIRQKGRLFWPRRGNGTYWSPEISAAQVIVKNWSGGYYAERTCSCRPFNWVRELYETRQRIGKATRGYPIKLGINGLYGKLAQRQGAAPFRDHIAAGLITAIVRSWLLRAAASGNPADILMIATDAVYSRSRLLDLDIGPQLGQWEETERPTGIFIVQPGIYWSPGSETKIKTRGIPRSRIIARRDEFEAAWNAWVNVPDRVRQGGDPPTVTVPLTQFIGHRMALHRNKPQLAGSWIEAPKRISFDWQSKRAMGYSVENEMVHTVPKAGSAFTISESYQPMLLTDLSDQLLEQEAMPDFEPWGNSGE